MSDAADSVAPSLDPDDTVLAKIEEFFDSNGLSGFGKAMAKQWVVSALSDRFPAGSCARVLHWLRQQVVGKRIWYACNCCFVLYACSCFVLRACCQLCAWRIAVQMLGSVVVLS